MDIADYIITIPLFKGLTRKDGHEVSRIAKIKIFEKDQKVFTEGEEGDGIYLILQGQVRVYKISSEGKEQTYHIFGPGESFGEVVLFTEGGFPAYAESVTRTSLLFFPRNDFISVLKKNSSISINMIATLSRRLREFSILIENLSLKETPERFAAYLLSLSKEHNDSSEVDLGISKGQLASLLGTVPSTLSRILSKMNSLGVIKSNGSKIRILDHAKLEKIALTGIEPKPSGVKEIGETD